MVKGLVSVVVPVYKTEKYLDCCVESITKQSYQSLEIILVDDGSPDNCGRICDGWAAKDSRIKVIHKENQGLSSARNTGIEAATGEYICFFDSDDFISLDFIERMITLAKAENTDLVVCGMVNASAEGKVITKYIPAFSEPVYRGERVQGEFLPNIVSHDPATGKEYNVVLSACCVLFSMELINRAHWRFVSERKVLSEDVYSLLTLYKDVQSVAILDDAMYYYRSNGASISRSFRPDRFERNREFYLQCLDLCKQCGYSDEVIRRCKEPYLANVFGTVKQAVAYYDSYHAVKAELKKMIDDSVFQQVLYEKRKDKEKITKKIFYCTVRRKWYFACYLLLKAKLRQ